MRIIKLNAIDSTNVYLKDLLHAKSMEDFTVVVADKQLKGRGQMGTVWESESGKNLTFSMLKQNVGLKVTQQFVLNMQISLAVYDALQELNVPNLRVKWPNDILSGKTKICGILIENILSGSIINASIIGIGLNVNQVNFGKLPKVSSMKALLGQNFDLDEVLQEITKKLRNRLLKLQTIAFSELKESYEKVLFRKDKPSTFETPDGELQMGFIRGVSEEGKLVVTLQDNIQKVYGLKEIKLLY